MFLQLDILLLPPTGTSLCPRPLSTEAAPKLDPDPNAAPDPKGVEKRLLPAGVEAGAPPPNKEGVDADPNNEADEEGKIDDWGEAPEEKNREDPGAVAGVENSDDEEVPAEADEDETKRENPPPDEADKGAPDS